MIAASWPGSLVVTGVLFLGAVLALRSPRTAPLAAVLVGFDLLIVNGAVNLTADRAFYTLRPEVAKLVEDARREEGAWRWFAYGARDDRELRWAPEVTRRNADVWLYYLDRQSLLPRSHVLDGLEAAFDEDRVGWSPPGSTLQARERLPLFYRQHHERIRRANVRFVLSFRPLPDDLVQLRGEARLPEMLDPLRLYELRDPRPRAFRPEEEGKVDFDRLDPHTVRLRIHGPPGIAIVVEGYHGAWVAESSGRPRALRKADDRYWAIETVGGGETITVRFQPAWRPVALSAFGVGALGVLTLLAIRRPASS